MPQASSGEPYAQSSSVLGVPVRRCVPLQDDGHDPCIISDQAALPVFNGWRRCSLPCAHSAPPNRVRSPRPAPSRDRCRSSASGQGRFSDRCERVRASACRRSPWSSGLRRSDPCRRRSARAARGSDCPSGFSRDVEQAVPVDLAGRGHDVAIVRLVCSPAAPSAQSARRRTGATSSSRGASFRMREKQEASRSPSAAQPARRTLGPDRSRRRRRRNRGQEAAA